MNWKFWQLQPAPVIEIQPVTRDACRLRLEEFRSNQALCNGVASALNGAYMVMALDTLRNEHVGKFVLPHDASIESRAMQQARAEGYGMAISNLESLAIHEKLRAEPNITFEPEEMEGVTLPSEQPRQRKQ